MTNRISGFNDADRRVVETALKERYAKRASIELADSEIRLQADHEKDRGGATSGETGQDLDGR